MLYHVNQKSLTLKDGVQLLDLLHTIGFSKFPAGKNDYPCTADMIHKIASSMTSIINAKQYICCDELVDLAIDAVFFRRDQTFVQNLTP